MWLSHDCGGRWIWTTKQAKGEVMFKLLLNDTTLVQGEDVVVEAGRMIELTSRQQQSQRTLLDWLRAGCGIQEPSNKLLTLAISSPANNSTLSRGIRSKGKTL
jgi:hypothetical protein